jgi:hypothetical protein
MRRKKRGTELFCIYNKLYSEIENVKNDEKQFDKYITYLYKGQKVVVGKDTAFSCWKTGLFSVPTNRFNHSGVNFRTRLQLG